METHDDMLKKEIKFRMESDAWDLSMARRVMDSQFIRNKKVLNIWSIASLATAAMAFIIFMSGFYSAIQKNSSFTGSVYSYAYIKNDSNLDNDTVAARVELLINETYPMR